MNDDRQRDSMMISATQLKARLKALGAIDPPGGLRDRLMTTIPDRAAHRAGQSGASSRPRVWRRVALAAGIVVIASVMVRFLVSLPTPPRSIVDINDRAGAATWADHNHPSPLDSNCCDSNVAP